MLPAASPDLLLAERQAVRLGLTLKGREGECHGPQGRGVSPQRRDLEAAGP